MIELNVASVCCDLYSRSDAISVALHTDGIDDEPVGIAGRSIVEKFRRTADGRNDNVDSPIIIEIAECTTAVSGTYRHAVSRLFAHVLKCAISKIAKDTIRLPIVLKRVNRVSVLVDVR